MHTYGDKPVISLASDFHPDFSFPERQDRIHIKLISYITCTAFQAALPICYFNASQRLAVMKIRLFKSHKQYHSASITFVGLSF